MTGFLIALGLGLAAGGVAGFTLGREDRGRCRNCLSVGAERYADGFDDGWRDGAAAVADRVRERHMDGDGRIWMDEWDLRRIGEDMLEALGKQP